MFYRPYSNYHQIGSAMKNKSNGEQRLKNLDDIIVELDFLIGQIRKDRDRVLREYEEIMRLINENSDSNKESI
jgi:hypothetical protein